MKPQIGLEIDVVRRREVWTSSSGLKLTVNREFGNGFLFPERIEYSNVALSPM